jgi:hypothetical protein
MVRFFTLLGFRVSEEGIVTTTTSFARFISNLLVRDGHFIKLDTNIYTKK